MTTKADQTPEGYRLSLAGTVLVARASGALWIPQERALLVSDLHFGKAERNARRGGGLWPPYENEATLTQLEQEAASLDPAMIVTLGDSFDDPRCVAALAESDRARITALADNHRLIWITGNHDPLPKELPGDNADSLDLGPLTLRHIADATQSDEISGHYHPKATVFLRGRRITRKCFLYDTRRIIMPAFGAYTGGLDVLDTAFEPLFDETAHAVLTGEKALPVSLTKLRTLAVSGFTPFSAKTRIA